MTEEQPDANVLVGTTSLLKRPLSYRWVIHDAKVFLNESKEGLRSPAFSVTLPPNHQTSWHLHAQKKETRQYSHISYTLCLSLWQRNAKAVQSNGSNNGAPSSNDVPLKALLAQCRFSFVGSTITPFATTAPSAQCTVDKPVTASCVTAIKAIDYEGINHYLSDGTLTVQFNALLCLDKDKNKELEPSTDNLPLYNGMKTLLDENLFIDVAIKCGDREFKAHKVVLASQSPVFKTMLESDTTENKASVIDIPNTDSDVVSEVLTYLYTGAAPKVDTMAKDLLAAANQYELSRLLSLCEKQLISTMSVPNVVELLVIADQHSASELKTACLKFIYYNSTEVHQTSGWQELKLKSSPVLMDVVDYVPS